MSKRVWVLLCCMLLVVLCGSIAMAGSVLYDEKFENQELFFKTWQKGLGIVKVENGKLYMGEGSTKEGATAEERACLLYCMPLFAIDFDLEIDMRIINVNPTYDKSFVAVTVRKVMPLDKYWNSGYTVRLTKGHAEMSFWKVGQKPISVVDKADFSGGLIQLKVEARGGNINVYQNNELVMEYEESPSTAYMQGFFGLATEATAIEISKFKVTEI
jgi:hypothetical protein